MASLPRRTDTDGAMVTPVCRESAHGTANQATQGGNLHHSMFGTTRCHVPTMCQPTMCQGVLGDWTVCSELGRSTRLASSGLRRSLSSPRRRQRSGAGPRASTQRSSYQAFNPPPRGRVRVCMATRGSLQTRYATSTNRTRRCSEPPTLRCVTASRCECMPIATNGVAKVP